MVIQIDTREHARAIAKIKSEFEKRGIKYIVSKMYAGDYMSFDNPRYIIDRKQNIREIATNCTTEQARLEREMQKLIDTGSRMTFLITENRISNKKIESLEDLILWEPAQGRGTVRGETIYRKLKRWERIYPIDFEFCSKADAGKRIIELLEANSER